MKEKNVEYLPYLPYSAVIQLYHVSKLSITTDELGRIAQSITCLATDVSLTRQFDTSLVRLIPSTESFTKYWLTACSSLPRKKCGLVNWPFRHDHSC